MSGAAAVLLAACVVACAGRPAARPLSEHIAVGTTVASTTTDFVEVGGPLVVAFFPPVSKAQVEGDPGVRSALEHFESAVAALRACLGPRGIPVEAVQTPRLVVENGARRDDLPLAAITNESIGCYVTALDRDATVVRASAGASSLVALCPAAAAVYFDVPACCPDGFRCCPDGRVVDAASDCDAAGAP